MNRRTLLATWCLGLGVGGGYLGLNRNRTPSVPDGLTVETLHLPRDVSSDGFDRDGDSLPARAQYHTIVADAETAAAELATIDDVTGFVEATDFADSYLVVVQTGMQSAPELVLTAIRSREDGLHLEVEVDAPLFGANDDLVTHSLLVRVTDAHAGVPETVTVDIDGYV